MSTSTEEPELRPRSNLGPKIGLGIILTGLVIGGAWLVWRAYRISVLRQEATQAARAGDWTKAEEAVSKLTRYEAVDLEASRIRTMAALARRDPLSASRFLLMMPENAPIAADAYEQAGFLLRDLFHLEAAEAAFRRSLKLDPNRLQARRALIAILGLDRRGQEQEVELWALLQRTPAKVEALRVLAQAAPAIPPDGLPPGMDEGQTLLRVLEAEPGNRYARAALAAYFRGRGQADRATKTLQIGDPSSSVLRLESLASAIEEGDLVAAAQQLNTVAMPRDWFQNPRYYRLKGDFFDASGKLNEAIRAYRQALEIDTRGVELHYRLGQALLAAKQPKEAEPFLAYARDTLTLKNLVARLPDQGADPAACLEAEKLCRDMSRDREANAWRALAEPGVGAR